MSLIDDGANIINSMVTEGCYVDGNLNYSILFSDVTVENNATVEYSVVMRNTKIGKNADVKYAIIADDVIIEDGAIVGAAPEEFKNPEKWGIAVIGQGAIVKSCQVVKPGEMIEPNSGRS